MTVQQPQAVAKRTKDSRKTGKFQFTPFTNSFIDDRGRLGFIGIRYNCYLPVFALAFIALAIMGIPHLYH